MALEVLVVLTLFFLFALASINAIASVIESSLPNEKEKLFPKSLLPHLDFSFKLIKACLRFCIAFLIVLLFNGTALKFWSLIYLFSICFIFLSAEIVPLHLARKYPEKVFYLCSIPTSFLLVITSPLTFAFLKLFGDRLDINASETPIEKAKKKIGDIVDKIGLSEELSLHDMQLIESVLDFKDRIAREVMVPRVDVFSLPYDTTIQEAARLIDLEGYSRIPIFKNTVDNIVGVLMYKDILKKYMEYKASNSDESILNAPIETIQKSVLYTPETKKISNLLLEFRKKQSHLAIVVDEYGGTEGIVTIEDILEEIVGEIADEYDEEEDLYFGHPDGSYIVDARMNILDVQEQLEITIPQEGEYDTVGGFIFHTAGSIPPRGFQIHHENFKLEVLKSDDRRIQKVKLEKTALKDSSIDDSE